MSFTQAIKSNSFVKLLAVIAVSLPLVSSALDRSAIAAPLKGNCISAKLGVKVCADPKGAGYEIYSKLGPITSQKQYIGRDGGAVTFGTISVFGTHAQVQGGVKINPLRLEGKAEVCARKNCKSDSFSLNLQ